MPSVRIIVYIRIVGDKYEQLPVYIFRGGQRRVLLQS